MSPVDEFERARAIIAQVLASQITPQEARLYAAAFTFQNRLRVFGAASEASRALASNRLPKE